MIPFIYKPAQTRTPFMTDLSKVPTSPASLFFFNVGAWRTGGANTREGHAAEIGAANGITNARGLAGMYAPLANGGLMRGGGKLVDGNAPMAVGLRPQSPPNITLGRKVAIKILPGHLAQESQALLRFQRESLIDPAAPNPSACLCRGWRCFTG